LIYPYRAFPLDQTDPVTKLDFAWRPALKVLIWYNHKRTAPIESIVDTGADHCIFDAELGEALGIPVTKGDRCQLLGFAKGASAMGFVHKVALTVAAHRIETRVVFAYGIASTGILGQHGFFDHFTVTFDWTPDPPCFDLRRIPRN